MNTFVTFNSSLRIEEAKFPKERSHHENLGLARKGVDPAALPPG